MGKLIPLRPTQGPVPPPPPDDSDAVTSQWLHTLAVERGWRTRRRSPTYFTADRTGIHIGVWVDGGELKSSRTELTRDITEDQLVEWFDEYPPEETP